MARREMTVRIEGLEEILVELARRTDRGKAALDDALQAGGELLAKAARQNVAAVSDRVADAITVTVLDAKPGKARVAVHLGKQSWIGRFIEYGTAAHVIKPTNRQALLFAGRYSARAQHQGMPARPFMRPAFDERQRDAQALIRQRLAEAIT